MSELTTLQAKLFAIPADQYETLLRTVYLMPAQLVVDEVLSNAELTRLVDAGFKAHPELREKFGAEVEAARVSATNE